MMVRSKYFITKFVIVKLMTMIIAMSIKRQCYDKDNDDEIDFFLTQLHSLILYN